MQWGRWPEDTRPMGASMRLSALKRAEKALDSLAPAYQFRAQDAFVSSGSVVAIPNKRTAGADALVSMGSALPGPSADALFGGAKSLAFAGTQYLQSNKAPSAWQFLQDNTGAEVITVLAFEPGASAGNNCVWTTRAGTTGACSFRQGTGAQSYAVQSSGALNIINTSGGNLALGTAMYIGQCLGPSAGLRYQLWANAASTAYVLATTTGATPDFPFRLAGAADGTVSASMRWCETLVFTRVLHEYERQQVREYIAAKYGLAAPTLAGADRDVMSMLPFSQARADYYAAAGGAVTAWLDRARPGHSFAQGSAPAQAPVPSADASLNGALSATFGGAHYYPSTLPASSWRFLHEGAGVTLVYVYVKTSDSVAVLFATSTNPGGGNGLDTYVSGVDTFNTRAAGLGGATAGWVNGAHVFRLSHGTAASPQQQIARSGSVVSSGPYASALGASAPEFALVLGRSTASVIGRWAEMLIFNRVLTAAELARLSAYTTARYARAA